MPWVVPDEPFQSVSAWGGGLFLAAVAYEKGLCLVCSEGLCGALSGQVACWAACCTFSVLLSLVQLTHINEGRVQWQL